MHLAEQRDEIQVSEGNAWTEVRGRKLRFQLEFISGVSLKELKYKAKTRKP